jgi:hypothetical protein
MSICRQLRVSTLDQAVPLAGWQLPEELMTLRRLLEARMGKQGKRAFVQVLRLMEVFSCKSLNLIQRSMSDYVIHSTAGMIGEVDSPNSPPRDEWQAVISSGRA